MILFAGVVQQRWGRPCVVSVDSIKRNWWDQCKPYYQLYLRFEFILRNYRSVQCLCITLLTFDGMTQVAKSFIAASHYRNHSYYILMVLWWSIRNLCDSLWNRNFRDAIVYGILLLILIVASWYVLVWRRCKRWKFKVNILWFTLLLAGYGLISVFSVSITYSMYRFCKLELILFWLLNPSNR